MTVFQTINAVVVAVGIPAIIGAFVFIGRKLQVLDDMQKTMIKMKTNIKVVCDYLVNDDNFNHRELQAYSPLRLTDEGNQLIYRPNTRYIHQRQISRRTS